MHDDRERAAAREPRAEAQREDAESGEMGRWRTWSSCFSRETEPPPPTSLMLKAA